ncbi:MAG: nuclear transport factor 2 family protein [Bacteroidia bacterium]|nr:nuclear transport factor 2 family protein [Bacteroidia bacterium]
MKNLTLAAVIVMISACGSKNTEKQNTTDATKIEQEIRSANDQLYAGLNAMFTGDLELLNNLWSHSEYITDMGPFGGRLTSWNEVSEEFRKEAAMKFGGKIVCKDLHVFAGTDMGYIVCVEEGENMSADGKQVVVSHRATNIFHLENGQWKLVHHQTNISTQLEKAFEAETK